MAFTGLLLRAGQARLYVAEHDEELVGGLVVHLQGGTWSTAHSADRVDLRHSYPGTMHLVRWTIIRDALAAGSPWIDLGGVDLPGHRAPPAPGEPNYGLYEHKRGFGAVWTPREPARRIVLRPWADRVARVSRRAPHATGHGQGPPARMSTIAEDRAPLPAPASVAALRRDDGAWDAFVSASPFGFHTQLSPWARVKAANGWSAVRVVADGGSGPIGAQVLVRRVGPGPFALGYAPRGPVATTWDEASLAAFGAALRLTARRLRLTHVTVDPPVEAGPGRTLFADAGWRPADDVQPSRTREVPLGRPEEELWGDLRSKWRQYVQKARRSGVVIVEGDRRDLDAFYAIFVDTARRTGFIPRTPDSYRQVWDAFQPSGAARLLFARLPGGEPVATLFLLRCGTRVVEPYGGMTACRRGVTCQLPPEMGGHPSLRRGGCRRLRHVGPARTPGSSSSRPASAAARSKTN